MWYMVSIEWNIVLTLSLLTQHIVYQLCMFAELFLYTAQSSCGGDTHLQCVVCDSGNWCLSLSHCMMDCVDVLFYRQSAMRS